MTEHPPIHAFTDPNLPPLRRKVDGGLLCATILSVVFGGSAAVMLAMFLLGGAR